MKFQPGDQVSFINEKQKGVVKKILSNNMVIVEIEDGFEFPVRENELVKTGIIQERQPEKSEIKKEMPVVHDPASVIDICADKSIIIAAIPNAAGAVLTGALTYHLVNRSGHDLLFSFHLRKENQWKGIYRGISVSGTGLELVHFKREALIDIQSFLFQGLLYSEKELLQVTTIRNEFAVLIPSLHNARKDVAGMAGFAAIKTVHSISEEEEIPVKELLEKYQNEKQATGPLKSKTFSGEIKHPGKYGILINEKEIDLHIEELVPDISGLSNAEMLEIQLRQFSREMDNAIRNHFRKIIFIHGVGNGKLKSEIRKELRHYEGVAFKDADSRNYGQGATEVTFV